MTKELEEFLEKPRNFVDVYDFMLSEQIRLSCKILQAQIEALDSQDVITPEELKWKLKAESLIIDGSTMLKYD